jgi:tetratricopeptide (TPR) repeat protein
VEFIYKEPGVNKPLTSEDDEKKNLNKTKYRIQINKIDNAIKEIVSGLIVGEVVAAKEKEASQLPWEEVKKEKRVLEKEKPVGSKKRRMLSGLFSIIIFALLIAIYVYPKIFKRGALQKLASSAEKIAVAVMPFQNMTNDSTFNNLQDAIQLNLISALSNTGEFRIRQEETISTLMRIEGLESDSHVSPVMAGELSKKLSADIFIYGNIQKAGSLMRINAQLVDTKTMDVLTSLEINFPCNENNLLSITDSLRRKVTDFLLISKIMKKNPVYQILTPPTTSPEAFSYFIYGSNALHTKADFRTAISWYLKAVAIDSNFYDACYMLMGAYANEGMAEQSLKLLLKLYKKRDQMPPDLQMWVNYAYACKFESPFEQLKILKQMQEIDDQDIGLPYPIGNIYLRLGQFDKAITEYKKTMDIVHRIGQKDSWIYASLGEAYHLKGEYRKEKKIYKQAEKYYVDHNSISFSWVVKDQAILSFALKDSDAANRYIEKYRSILNENSWSEADIVGALAAIYSRANVLDKAETYYRKLLSLEPGKPDTMNALAWFLIDKERNINEGLELIDKALPISPGNYSYLETKGWGLYKQGKFEEALDYFEKSREMQMPLYNYELNLRIEKVKKAVGSLK